MKLSQSQSKPINTWLYVLLSIPPLVCLYPLRKLKKIRVMLLINLAILGVSYGIIFLFRFLGYEFHNGPTFTTTAIVTVVQCILVYNWSKEYNKKLTS